MGNSKVCTVCKENILLEGFKNRSDKPHLKMSECTKCYNKKRYNRRIKNYPEREKARSKESSIRSKLKSKYNLTLEEYNQMSEAQNHRCKICGKESKNKRLAVDHCHITGRVRSLLCSNCNTGIGQFKESPMILQSAMNYLFLHNT